jgi:2-haloacid dehalogenase
MLLSRRVLLAQAAGLTTLTPGSAANAQVVRPAPAIKAVAFDALAIFDLRPIAARADVIFPGKGQDLAAAWRTRQFEYTWLRTLMGSYVDFWQVTEDALSFAAATLGLALTAASRAQLMDEFLNLKAWPDVAPTLSALRAAGVRLAFLTNFSEAMLEANVRSAGLEGLFEAQLSTDRARAYKPDPRAYALGVDYFQLPPEQIAFAAFAGWDAAGAKRFGYWTYWCNRLGAREEVLGASPDMTRVGLADLRKHVSAAA